MKPLSIVLSINLSLAAVIIIFTGYVLGFMYVMPLFLGLAALLNFAMAGIFWHSQENAFLRAFLVGGIVMVLCTAGSYGYMYFLAPEKLNFMKDLANGA